jgi:hypothetical protein
VNRLEPAQRKPAPDPPPVLSVRTGLVLTSAGAILLLAVHARVWFLNVPAAGMILVVTGLIWLWLPVPEKRALIGRQFDRIMSYLQWDARESELRQSRHPLTDLLTESAMTAAGSPSGPAALERSHNKAAPATPSAG